LTCTCLPDKIMQNKDKNRTMANFFEKILKPRRKTDTNIYSFTIIKEVGHLFNLQTNRHASCIVYFLRVRRGQCAVQIFHTTLTNLWHMICDAKSNTARSFRGITSYQTLIGFALTCPDKKSIFKTKLVSNKIIGRFAQKPRGRARTTQAPGCLATQDHCRTDTDPEARCTPNITDISAHSTKGARRDVIIREVWGKEQGTVERLKPPARLLRLRKVKQRAG
jgi:hypothetical protein